MAFSGSFRLVPGPSVCAQGVLKKSFLQDLVSSACAAPPLSANSGSLLSPRCDWDQLAGLTGAGAPAVRRPMTSVPPKRQSALPAVGVDVLSIVRHSSFRDPEV